MGGCSSSLFVCPSGCNWPGHRKLFSTILCLPVENAKGRLWSCKGDSAEGIRLLWAVVPAAFLYAWAVAIGPGTGICFPLFYACLWKTQRKDCDLANRNCAEGIRQLWAIVPAAFLYAWAVAIGLGAEIHFPLFLACLWKIQREDYGRAREITRKESGSCGRLFQQSFCMPERLQSDRAQKPVFHYFWPVCGKCKGKTMAVQGK